MSTPTGDNAFLHELELNVRAELILAETSQREEENGDVPIDEWLFDPVDAQREEILHRNLLGAVEALEEGSRDHDHPSTELPEGVGARRRTPGWITTWTGVVRPWEQDI